MTIVTTDARKALFDVRVERRTDTEWDVCLASSRVCVGYVTDLGDGFEAIDVLPPYRVAVRSRLEEALAEILDTIAEENESILAAYTGEAAPARR